MRENAKPLLTWTSFAAMTVLMAAFVGVLIFEQRPGWCKYGLGLWTGAWTRCTSQHFVDPYSFTHALHGILFYWFLYLAWPKLAFHWRLVAATAIEIGWELLENSAWVIERYRQQTASLDYTGDSILNSVGDVLSTIVGFYFASRFSWKASAIAFVAVELVLLILIRDNLTLNVLMLFVPLDAIKQWQLQ